ncbi:hypothetical protein HWV62_28140 [Athelia sp. TMB]|nr:hypothetical protein HWV62_28140 [Athelia sp. TMB]
MQASPQTFRHPDDARRAFGGGEDDDEARDLAADADADVLEGQDESVRIAVRALGAMRNSSRAQRTSSAPTPALSSTASTASTSSSPLLSPADDDARSLLAPQKDDPRFAARVAHFPLVGSALRVYEAGKNSSRLTQYGAALVEGGVKAVSGRVGVDAYVGQLDEFACRQLDRIDSYRGRGREEEVRERDEGTRRDASVTMASPSRSRSTSPVKAGDDQNTKGGEPTETPEEGQQVAQRSRWQAMLMEAGGISAALSEESMRRLKYCLQWLQYATAHIDAQILILREFTAALAASPQLHQPISPAHLRTLAAARRDVVRTVRQVVDVVSKYAGGALPEPARSRVRGFILLLPQRWAHRAGEVGVVEGLGGASSSGVGAVGGAGRARAKRTHKRGAGSIDSPVSSRPTSPVPGARARREGGVAAAAGAGGGGGAAGAVTTTVAGAAQAAQRILTLSTESLDMMRGVTAVVKESLDRADAWVERLRIVGVQRAQQHELDAGEFPAPDFGPASPGSLPSSPGPLDAPSPSPSVYGSLGRLRIHEDDDDDGGGDGDRTPRGGGEGEVLSSSTNAGAEAGMDVDA